MKMLHVRVSNLDMANAKDFEKLAEGLPDVLSTDIWAGRAEIGISRPEAGDDIAAALKAAGYDVTEAVVCDKPGSESQPDTLRVAIDGMTCRSCEVTVERRFKKIPGVKKVQVNLAIGDATVTADPGAGLSLERLREALKGDHYRISPWTKRSAKRPIELAEERPNFWQLIGFFALAAVVAWILSRSQMSTDSWTSNAGGFWAAALVGLVAGASSCMAVSGGLLLSSISKFHQRYASSTTLGRMRPVMLFVSGRVLSYGVFGGLIGAIGQALVPSVAVTGVLMMLAALFMLIMGLDMLHLAPRWLRRLLPSTPKSVAHKVMDVESKDHWVTPLLLGGATFFIPCGFTQAFQVFALSTHSFSAGAAVLAGFAMGTVPALVLLGLASSALKGAGGRTFMQFAGALVVILGILNIQNALVLTGFSFDFPERTAAVPAGAPGGAADGPALVDGKQVIRMVVGGDKAAYEPDRFTVKAGVPVRWEIDQRTSSGCLAYIVSRQLGINSLLKRGDNIIEFTATKPGNYTFSCSMGMFRGTITATP